MRFLIIFLTSFVFVSTLCFAEDIQVDINEPEDKDIGMKIDMLGRDFTEKIIIDKSNFLLINKELTDIRIKKDNKNGLNKFSALVAYNLYAKNSKPSDNRFLYVQCPITRKTYVDQSPPPKEKMIGGEMRLVYEIDHEVLSEEFLDSGSYSFLSSSDDKVPQLSNTFPMVGKVNQLIDIEAMCLDIQLAYDNYLWAEIFRDITLKKFGILE